MKNQCILITFLILFTSCKQEDRIVKRINFKTEYKFSSEIEDNLKKDTNDWRHQISASDFATNGDYKNALKHWDLAFKSKPRSFTSKQVDSIQLKYKIVSAKDYIIEQSKTNQIIIINEAHHNSSHRFFTKSLLKELYDTGYKNLGLEALGNGKYFDSLLNKRKYPIQTTGFYIKDPQFGNMVRTALEIGYNVFSYEQTVNADGELREIEQAKNIKKMIDKHPNEKFLIHCGFDHVLEGKYPAWKKTMSGRLTDYTGINPFTINQTKFSEKSNLEFNSPLLKALPIKQASVILDKQNRPFKYERNESWADIAVFHPNTNYVNQRPNWVFKSGNKNVKIQLGDLDIDFPVMVFAFKKGEDINTAVPIDICEVKKQSETPHLALKKGTYEIVVSNIKNDAFKFEIEVN